jgi:hypothetical protein
MSIIIPGGGGRKPVPSSALMAIDTEYEGTHTLTVQAGARLAPDRACWGPNLPDIPADFDSTALFPARHQAYGRSFRHVERRPVKLGTPDLRVLLAIAALCRPAARHFLNQVAPSPTGDFAATSRHVATPLLRREAG